MKVNPLEYYREARRKNGFLEWWPADSPFEVIIGAILTQNTAWSNVEKSIARLKAENILSPELLLDLDENTLAEYIRSSGYYRQKSKKVKSFLQWAAAYSFDWEKIAKLDKATVREELLVIWGIGPETADSILLYALQKPSFVIDAYTFRIARRHQWYAMEMESAYNSKIYHRLQEEISKEINTQIQDKEKLLEIYLDFHAQIVHIGKNFCKKTEPLCQDCPWKKFLPQ